jgi:hypothetical protein
VERILPVPIRPFIRYVLFMEKMREGVFYHPRLIVFVFLIEIAVYV